MPIGKKGGKSKSPSISPLMAPAQPVPAPVSLNSLPVKEDSSIDFDPKAAIVHRVSFVNEDVEKEISPDDTGDYDILMPLPQVDRSLDQVSKVRVGIAVNAGVAREIERIGKAVYRSKQIGDPPKAPAVPAVKKAPAKSFSDNQYIPEFEFSDFGDTSTAVKSAGHALVSPKAKGQKLHVTVDQGTGVKEDRSIDFDPRAAIVHRVSFVEDDAEQEITPDDCGDYDILMPLPQVDRSLDETSKVRVGIAVQASVARKMKRIGVDIYRSKQIGEPPPPAPAPPTVANDQVRAKAPEPAAKEVGTKESVPSYWCNLF